MEFLKHILIEERGIGGGTEEKIRKTWLGRENVVAGLPSLDR